MNQTLDDVVCLEATVGPSLVVSRLGGALMPEPSDA
jgi:hypothetical protein